MSVVAPTTIDLVGKRIAVSVSPGRGGSIVHVGETLNPEANVLSRHAWATPVPASLGVGYGDSTTDWLSEYRGGWQLLTPNAGAECVVDGTFHPCNSRVSRLPWKVQQASATSVTLETGTESPLTVTRTVEVRDAKVHVQTTISNDSTVCAPAVVTEHIALAAAGDDVVIAPGRSRWRREPDGWVEDSPEEIWEQSGLWGRPSEGEERVASLVGSNEGWIERRSSRRGHTVRVTWDPAELPYLWYWQARSPQRFPWFGRADMIGLEPSSASRSDGLSAAIARKEAWSINGGESVSVSVAIELIS